MFASLAPASLPGPSGPTCGAPSDGAPSDGARTGGVWADGLDDAQAAVAAHGDGPLVVLAGAGTGKTRALVARVAHLLSRGVPPERVLLLTFTRRAAEEMLWRASQLAGLDGRRRPFGGTFHAVAHRIVSAHSEVLGLPKGFGVLTPGEGADLMEIMRADFELSGTRTRAPRSATLVEVYSRCVNTRRPLSDVLAGDYPWCRPHQEAVGELFRAYTARKRAQGLLDYDDLLLYWDALLGDPAVGRHLSEAYEHVLVDEYQDLNPLQAEIVCRLAPRGRGLTVVGDEAQAVYGFRGASARHLREAVLGFPGALVLRLERNFRSRQQVLDVANALRPGEAAASVTLYADRGPGQRPLLVRCADAVAEARALVDNVLAAHEAGERLNDQAVLVRASHHSDLIELELSARGVPYRKYGGLRFLETAHVKDFIAAGRLLSNPHDELSWYRLLRLHDGVGPTRARRLVAHAMAATDALEDWPSMVASADPPVRGPLSSTLALLAQARTCAAPGPAAEALVATLAPLIALRYPGQPTRTKDLQRLAGSARTATDLRSWLAELALDPPESTGDLAGPPVLDEDYVVISTIHSAKGLEWGTVHVPHMVDGFMPIDMALGSAEGVEEEQRLLYVAVTRARDRLYLYTPLRMHYHRRALDDRHGFAPESRFLTDDVRRLFEVHETGRGPLGPGAVTTEPGHRVAVDLDHLWC